MFEHQYEILEVAIAYIDRKGELKAFEDLCRLYPNELSTTKSAVSGITATYPSKRAEEVLEMINVYATK